jgi:hypothetical protein
VALTPGVTAGPIPNRSLPAAAWPLSGQPRVNGRKLKESVFVFMPYPMQAGSAVAELMALLKSAQSPDLASVEETALILLLMTERQEDDIAVLQDPSSITGSVAFVINLKGAKRQPPKPSPEMFWPLPGRTSAY